MIDALFMILVLFFSCVGIFSLGYFLQNSMDKKRKGKKFVVIIPVKEPPYLVEDAIRSCMLKVDLGQLSHDNIIIWDKQADTEASDIAQKLSTDFGFTYVDGNSSIDEAIVHKIDLQ